MSRLSTSDPATAAEAPGVRPRPGADDSCRNRAEIVDLAALPPVECPCGTARRGFADREDFPGTVHLTQIQRNARVHYHKRQTEVYVILECDSDAAIELDGVRHAVQPRTSILIPPGVRHRACGEMTVLILCTPKFDSADEYFD